MAMIKCPECGQDISDKASKCVHCGEELSNNKAIKCSECGEELSNDETICHKCGCPVEQEEVKKPKITSKNLKKLVIAGVGGVVTIAVICSIVYFVSNMNPVGKYQKYVESGKTNDANILYEEKIKIDEALVKELIDLQNAEMDTIYNDFVTNKITYDESIKTIDVYLSYDSSKKYAKTIQDKIEDLNTSRIAFNQAVQSEENGEYATAIDQYKKVKDFDANYDTAQEKISSLSSQWKEEMLAKAEGYSKEKKYNEAIAAVDVLISTLGSTDELSGLKEKYKTLKSEQYVKVFLSDKSVTEKNANNWIFFNYVDFVFDITNNSDKTVEGIEGTAVFYDLFGKEIITINCDFTGISIQPGETYIKSGLCLECNDYFDDHMKLFNTEYSDLKCIYEVTKIVYGDGSTVVPN